MSWAEDLIISSFSIEILQEFLMVTFLTIHGLPVISLRNLSCLALNLFMSDTNNFGTFNVSGPAGSPT